MEKKIFIVTTIEGDIYGAYKAYSEDDIFIFLCKRSHGENYTENQLLSLQDRLYIDLVKEIIEI